MKKFFKKNLLEIILAILIISYIIIFSLLSIRRYLSLNSHYYDLGIMDQVVYNTSRGRILEMTNQQLKKNVSRLAIHFDPILIFFTPFYKIYSGPEVLLIGQTIILALGAWPIFLISQKTINKKLLGLIFASLYLLFFPVQRANLFDFHPVVLATTFLLWAIYFNLIKKNRWSFLFIFLSLLTKEQVGLIVAFYGFYLIFIKKDKRYGFWLSFLGIIFFVSTVFLIIPYFRQESHFALRYFGDFGDSSNPMIKNFLSPSIISKYFFRQETFIYITQLIKPNFYSLFSPLTLLISLPEWLINILSSNSNMRAIYFHYHSLIIPFLFYSLILGYKNFHRLVKNSWLQGMIFLLFLYFNFQSIYRYNPWPTDWVKNPGGPYRIDNQKLATIRLWQKKLSDENIKVATTPKLAPFFTERKTYINFLYDPAFYSMGFNEKEILEKKLNDYQTADFVIINKDEINKASDSLPLKFYNNFKTDANFSMIFFDNKSIEVYKKI
ncbi:MAG: DUF2079 domain-containing protein [Microgenomates group bacterium]|nr:DUF2079 domain-containing protein [Microgenomates group bacterium]